MFSYGLGCHSLCPHCESESTSASLGGPPVRRKAGLGSLYPGIALQSPHCNSQHRVLQWTCVPAWGTEYRAMVWTVCVFLTLFRVSQISGSLSDSLKRPPSVPANFSGCGSLSFASAPLPLGAGPVLLPSSLHPYQIRHGPTQSFLVVEDSCWYSVSVLRQLFYLWMYS